MKSILIIVPYFGKFKSSFPLFLKSVEYNSTIDFLIITADKRKFNYPKNVKVIYSTFEKEAQRMMSYFPFKTRCETPYKIVDYKPFYGEIYKEYTKDYDFWGWCETDLILGNIRKFATQDLLYYCDKLYIHGHFSLIKNNGYVNQLLLNSPVYDDIWHCREALNIPNINVHYDEFNGSVPTLHRLGCKIYANINDYADIDKEEWQLSLDKYNGYDLFPNNENLVFFYKKGSLYGVNEKGKKKEFLYIHLQKRKLINRVSKPDSFIIIPNLFIDFDPNFNLENEFSRQKKLANKHNNYFEQIIERYSKFEHQAIWQKKQEALKILKQKKELDCFFTKSILIIVPYFGKMNNYFDLFLKSAECNSTIDFLIITDDKRKFDYPKNVKVIYSTFSEESKRITSYFDFDARCDIPYKICDYRPFFGEIYKEYTKDYDFFGWCDLDVILGDIRHFITYDILSKHDRIYVNGNLSLMRNDSSLADALLNSPVYNNIWHCKEVYSVGNGTFYYDEKNGSVATFVTNNYKIFFDSPDDVRIADIDYRYYPFYLSKFNIETSMSNQKLLFSFKNGKLTGKSEQGKSFECVLVHLQKRKMENHVTDSNSFRIIPNQFLDLDDNFDYNREWERESIYEETHPEYEQSIYEKFDNSEYVSYWQPKREVLEILKRKN